MCRQRFRSSDEGEGEGTTKQRRWGRRERQEAKEYPYVTDIHSEDTMLTAANAQGEKQKRSERTTIGTTCQTALSDSNRNKQCFRTPSLY